MGDYMVMRTQLYLETPLKGLYLKNDKGIYNVNNNQTKDVVCAEGQNDILFANYYF